MAGDSFGGTFKKYSNYAFCCSISCDRTGLKTSHNDHPPLFVLHLRKFRKSGLFIKKIIMFAVIIGTGRQY